MNAVSIVQVRVFLKRKELIDNRLLDFIDQQCKNGKTSKDILDLVHQKVVKGDFGKCDDFVFPTMNQIKNRKKYALREGEQFKQFDRAYSGVGRRQSD